MAAHPTVLAANEVLAQAKETAWAFLFSADRPFLVAVCLAGFFI